MKFKQKKSVQAINYFARKGANNSINRLKLMKILWLSDRLHLMRYGRIILDDSYYAMPRGPVPSMTNDISRDRETPYVVENLSINKHVLTSQKEVESQFFSESEIEVMEEVWKKFGDKSGFQLEELSHFYPEWKRFEADIKDENKASSYEMFMEDFFRTPKNLSFSEFDFFANEDIEMAKEIYEETRVY